MNITIDRRTIRRCERVAGELEMPLRAFIAEALRIACAAAECEDARPRARAPRGERVAAAPIAAKVDAYDVVWNGEKGKNGASLSTHQGSSSLAGAVERGDRRAERVTERA